MHTFLLLLVLTSAPGKSADPGEVVASDPGLTRAGRSLLFGGSPYSGRVVERDTLGRVRAVTPYVRGLKHGVARTWHPNGWLASSRPYAHGIKVGRHLAWWENGRLRLDLNFSAGVYQGLCRAWYETGQLADEAHYRGGHERGSQRSWTMAGELFSNYVVRAGRRYGLLGARPCFTIEGDAASGDGGAGATGTSRADAPVRREASS